jgi:hypothetical protein
MKIELQFLDKPFISETQIGKLKLEFSAFHDEGFVLFLTARDEENRVLWSTPVMDVDGNVKKYLSVQEAVDEASKKLALYQS